MFIALRRTVWGAQAAQTTGRKCIMGGFPVEDKEEAFIKEDDCEVFWVFLSFYVLYVQNVLLSTKHPTHESAGLFTHLVRFYSLDSLAKAKEEERRKEELWARGRWVLSL